MDKKQVSEELSDIYCGAGGCVSGDKIKDTLPDLATAVDKTQTGDAGEITPVSTDE